MQDLAFKQKVILLADFVIDGGISVGASSTEDQYSLLRFDNGGVNETVSDTNPLPIYIPASSQVAYDEGLDVLKTIEQAGLETQYTDEEPVVTAQDTTIGYVDAGAVIEMRSAGFNSLAVDFDIVFNDATGNSFRIVKCDADGTNIRLIDGVDEELIPDADNDPKTFMYADIFANHIKIQIKHTANTGTTSNMTFSISKSFN